MSSPPGWELGSDFEWVSDSLLLGDSMPPWADAGRAVTYFESGRQALTAVSSQLRGSGRTRLLMPSYFCESMIEPFLRDGWHIEFVDVTDDLDVAYEHHLREPHLSAVLSMSYFGASESRAWLQALQDMQSAGAAVISDETHRVLSPGLRFADFQIASLRKMLPLPDGAFVVGDLAPVNQDASRVADVRLQAMRQKFAYLSGRNPGASYRELYQRAEELTGKRVVPAHMSDESLDLIQRLDYRHLVAIRNENAKALVTALGPSRYTPVRFSEESTPSHLVITGPGLAGLRQHLIQRRVFCPVHWPAPPLSMQPTGRWPSRYLSIPIDHRYTADDLSHVGHLINEYVTSDTEGKPHA